MTKIKDDKLKHLDREIIRAVTSFFWWFRRGNTFDECILKVKSSYSEIIGECVNYYIIKNVNGWKIK